MATPSGSCRCCGGGPLEVFHQVHAVPVSNSALFPTAQQAAEVATGDLVLGCCTSCGFIQNTAFDPTAVDYTEGYEDTQAHSARFVDYATEVSESLVERHGLLGARSLEVGCGKGDFLRILCAATGGPGIGYDPAVGPGAMGDDATSVELRAEPFTASVTEDADLLVCRHTLEHVADVGEFVEMVYKWARDRSPMVFFEVPDTMRILEEAAFWDLYYEHCSYFTGPTLQWLFGSSGFEVLDVHRAFDGQYLLIEARPLLDAPVVAPDPVAAERVLVAARRFAAEVHEMREQWRSRMLRIKEKGHSMVIWGGSSKSVAFLAETASSGSVRAVVDINPRKHGRFLPGSALEVVAPETLSSLEPDAVLVMNPTYVGEVEEMLESLCVETRVMVP